MKHKTPLLDELEKGKYPSFVTEIKKMREKKAMAEDLLGQLEYSYEKWFNQMKSLDDDLINFKRDAEGKLVFNTRYNTYDTVTRYYNYDSFAGINYVVDITKPAGQRVSIKTMTNGGAFQLDRTYVVAINSYRAQGGGGGLWAGRPGLRGRPSSLRPQGDDLRGAPGCRWHAPGGRPRVSPPGLDHRARDRRHPRPGD